MSASDYRIAKNNHHHAPPDPEMNTDLVALLLAGGDGKRLRELTSEIVGTPIPKQYCRLLNGISLLEAAISRVHLLFPRKCINVVINEDHLDLARDQVSALPGANVFVQPLNRDTGPGMVFALFRLKRAYRDATVAVFPTDHYIDRNWAFITHVMRAINAIRSMPDKIGVLGVVPDRPETGYGYILPSESATTSDNAFNVECFAEKPNSATAQHIIARGGLWNTFIMVFKVSRMLELLQQMVPGEFEKLLALHDHPEQAKKLYQTLEPWNFSTQVLARIPEHLLVFKVANVSWSDWGTRESIERTYRVLKQVPSWKISKAPGDKASIEESAKGLTQTG
jgi:mannose-1-phosphate guanylyltransferase